MSLTVSSRGWQGGWGGLYRTRSQDAKRFCCALFRLGGTSCCFGHDRERSRCHASHRASEPMLSRPFGFPSLMPAPLRGCALRLPRLWPSRLLLTDLSEPFTARQTNTPVICTSVRFADLLTRSHSLRSLALRLAGSHWCRLPGRVLFSSVRRRTQRGKSTTATR